MKLAIITLMALAAFAANSILCRLALRTDSIDPASFTAIRLGSGAIMLALVSAFTAKPVWKSGSWLSGFLLFAYAIAFSMAYVGLSAATGALILFACVQATMIVGSILQGRSPTSVQWIGLALAISGLTYLVLPGLMAPPPASAFLMAMAGVAWGMYSLRGRAAGDPIAATGGNFIRAAPFGILVGIVSFISLHGSGEGVLLAVASGALTSGLGYVAWYWALPSLGSIRAAIVQLAVPVVAAAGGILLLGEELSLRLVLASLIILSGVAMATLRLPLLNRKAPGQ